MNNISKRLYIHTGERIDPCVFFEKKIAVIGGGASAFDIAAVALENRAASVEMLVRRQELPKSLNLKFLQLAHPGIVHGFYFLPDEMRCYFFAENLRQGNSPPKTALERVSGYDRFHIHYLTNILQVVDKGDTAILKTNGGELQADLIICATGYCVDIDKQPELKSICSKILLWGNRVPLDLLKSFPQLGRFPYLGPHFEFMEAEPGTAPFLKNLYCFNYGAFLSHGMLSGDIPLISAGATRLAQGIASNFFLENPMLYFERLRLADNSSRTVSTTERTEITERE
jgi:cation diffusion facilitator CzcD-associated flavoprotein CzcO